jgi:hypothetical protein
VFTATLLAKGIVAALLGLAALGVCVRRAPLITLLCVGLLGFGLHTGALALPAAITTPYARADAALHLWQQRQSAALACQIEWTNVLLKEDQRQLDRAEQFCTSVSRAARP